MIVFYPEFAVSSGTQKGIHSYNERLEFLVENLIVLDCSNSMKLKNNFSRAQELAKVLVSQLNPSTYFNVSFFGSGECFILIFISDQVVFYSVF